MRLIVYSHDAFGLGNIRRMLTICQHLLATIPELSILVLSGSPAIHNFKIPARLDYIKLPCLGRDRQGKLAAKYLTSDVKETVKLRSNLIEAAVINFKPDLILVDKKPYGLLGELKPALDLLKIHSPQTKSVLLLRDILDTPQVTIREWQQQEYYQTIQDYYDRVLVVGMPEVFDLVTEYQLPQVVADRTVFCGYLQKDLPQIPAALIRTQLELKPEEKLIVVTPGGGEDGYTLVSNYLAARSQLTLDFNCKTLIIFGCEMPAAERDKLARWCALHKNIITLDFTERMMSYLQAADLVVSMAGYNTITEILSLNKKAVVVPRHKPSQEQLIRATRMENLGLLSTVAPQKLTPDNLRLAIAKQLNCNSNIPPFLDFSGLSNIQREIINLLSINLLPNYGQLDLFNESEIIDFYPLAI